MNEQDREQINELVREIDDNLEEIDDQQFLLEQVIEKAEEAKGNIEYACEQARKRLAELQGLLQANGVSEQAGVQS